MQEPLGKLHNCACFVSALACATEKNIGKGSHSVCALAGKRFGREAMSGQQQADDPLRAIEMLRGALRDLGILWQFEPFAGEKPSPIEVEGTTRKIRLVFHTCMVRNALFRYAHEQKQSLCSMAHGVFAGAMEQVFPGCKATLEIIHAGPNACLKELILEVQQ
jgi:hypothetical protein